MPDIDAGSSPLTRGKPVMQLSSVFSPGLIPAHAGKTYRFDPSASWHPAHPRSRGENKMQQRELSVGDGSSPLTRGKLDPLT